MGLAMAFGSLLAGIAVGLVAAIVTAFRSQTQSKGERFSIALGVFFLGAFFSPPVIFIVLLFFWSISA